MFLKYNWFAFVWALIILAGHAVPGNELPQPHWYLFEFDKLVHTVLFAVWAFSMGNGFNKQTKYYLLKRRYIGVIVIVSLMYSLSLETLQYAIFVDRAFQVEDLVADLLGTVMGLLFLNVLYGRLLKLT